MAMCDRCEARIDELRASGQRPDDVYNVGNPARPQMGHLMYFATDGRTALCIARPKAGDDGE